MTPTQPSQAAGLTETVAKALSKAFGLGQTYWHQTSSEYTSQRRKADETHSKYQALVTDTLAELARTQEVAAEVESKDGPCQEADGCPTERAVLQRFWRQQNEPKNRAASRVPVALPQEPVGVSNILLHAKQLHAFLAGGDSDCMLHAMKPAYWDAIGGHGPDLIPFSATPAPDQRDAKP